jgi:RNA-directed DNA polymerase
VRGVVKANKSLAAGKLIVKLNPMIRGWAKYHQHVVSKKTYYSVDDAIYHTIRRWIRRKHPRKADEWVAKKYFVTIGGNNWVFSGTLDEKTHYLADAAQVPIKRHVKIQGKANPYDPEWESY